jgi:hypothetical protein
MLRPLPRTLTCVWLTSVLLFVLAPGASASTMSFVGTFSDPTEVFTTTFSLSGTSDVFIQTWGFGGGTNGNGVVVPSGGFDPLIALFSGTGASATILTDINGPIFSADLFAGYEGSCPPGHTDTIAGTPLCGDATLHFSGLPAGTYTLLLTVATYIPFAVFDASNPLGAGFVDLTGGAFQTCVTDPSFACADRTGDYAVDLTISATPVPEPVTVILLAGGFAALAHRRHRRSRV